MCVAKKFHRRFVQNGKNYRALVRKVKAESLLGVKHGGDDILYSFSDGSKLLERTIVRELQLFKE